MISCGLVHVIVDLVVQPDSSLHRTRRAAARCLAGALANAQAEQTACFVRCGAISALISVLRLDRPHSDGNTAVSAIEGACLGPVLFEFEFELQRVASAGIARILHAGDRPPYTESGNPFVAVS